MSAIQNELDQFLCSVEKRAYRMAQISTQSQADALDIVQDSMLALVEKYSQKSPTEWKPLFYRILNNQMNSWHRKQKIARPFSVAHSITQVIPFLSKREESTTSIEELAVDSSRNPESQAEHAGQLAKVEKAIHTLPAGQQQVFFLRNWEGMSTRDTAHALSVSEGTVKTQYSRAMNCLKDQLEK